MLIGGSELQDLVIFSAGIGGTAIAQSLGPLRRAVAQSQSAPAMKLELRTDESGAGELVLQQAKPATSTSQE